MAKKNVSDFMEDMCSRKWKVDLKTLEQVVFLAIELAREGREGRKIGTIFVVSDTDKVMENSKCLILDPLRGHPESKKHISDSNLRETIKELAQLDGAFIISNDGTFLSACRFLNTSSEGVNLSLGLGSRHMAAASVSKFTDAVAVVVSETSVVRIFENGHLVSEIIPELWLMSSNYHTHIKGKYSTRNKDRLLVLSKKS